MLVPLNATTPLVTELADILQCSIRKLPCTYLGLLMGTTRPTMTDLMPVVDRVERKLSFSLCMMNQGSKLTLLNSLLTSIAIYPMCTIKFRPKLIKHLDKI